MPEYNGPAKQRIAVTLGDAEGIGPEIVYKSLRTHTPAFPVVVIGDKNKYADKNVPLVKHPEEARQKGVCFHHIDSRTIQSDASYVYVKTAIQWALEKKIGAMVTAPISKEKWLQAGVPYKGHTELLARTAGVDNHSMFFWSEDLKTALFTVHIPLQEVFRYLEKDAVIRFIRFTAAELERLFSQPFTFLVSGLNPHAGESGYLGCEEAEIITPAIETLKPEMDIRGPYPPDVVFLQAKETDNAVVVTWYHDQGLIPFKLLNIHRGVNLTLGLPYVRTSPDHGTAYDIAGKGIADPSSMIEAIRLAERLIR